MTIKDIQEQLAHRLNSVEELIQGGCKAFAEDNRDVYDKAAEFVNGGGVAIVVVTPELARAADGDAEGHKSHTIFYSNDLPGIAYATSGRSFRLYLLVLPFVVEGQIALEA